MESVVGETLNQATILYARENCVHVPCKPTVLGGPDRRVSGEGGFIGLNPSEVWLAWLKKT